MRVYSLINKKGGVGKTTLTENMAYVLAERYGARVLVIDNDDQGNDSQFFGINDPQTTLADIIMEKASIKEAIYHTRYNNIDIIPADLDLLSANVQMIKDEEITNKAFILQRALKSIDDKYDICIIDNPPHIDISVTNSLVASNEIIVVTEPQIYSIRGVEQMVEQIEAIKQLNPNLIFRGAVVNKFSSTPGSFTCMDKLRTVCKLFSTPIRETKNKLRDSATKGQTIYEYSPGCGFARDLIRFTDELLGGE